MQWMRRLRMEEVHMLEGTLLGWGWCVGGAIINFCVRRKRYLVSK
jgi:hypothetical protein